MFSLFSKSVKGERNIILDIQSGFVRGAVVEFQHGMQPLIISMTSKTIPSSMTPTDSIKITNEIIKIVIDVVTQVVKESGSHHFSTVHYIISSPWITSELKTIKINYEKDTLVTTDIIEKIIKDEIKRNSTSKDIQIVEQNIFEIKLNGYQVTGYEGKKTRSLEVSISTSTGSRKFFERLNSTVHSVVHTKFSKHHSAILMQYTGIRSILDTKQEYIYIHVHSELTDIIIVKNALCRHISSFPFGTTTLLRKLARSTDQGMKASESLLSLYEAEKLNETEKNIAKTAIDPLTNEWSESCKQSFLSIFDTLHLPRTVFISAHSHFDIFKEALLFKNDFNLDVIAYENIIHEDKNSNEKSFPQSVLMKMYTLVINNTK